jgi:EcoRII C terminal
MRQGFLSQYFTGVASKRLTAVDAEQHRSNQHEFSGVSELKAILGNADRLRIPARFLYLSDDDEPLTDVGFVSWYDARRAHPRRSEWRLYYSDTEVSSRASEHDVLIIATRPDGSVMAIIADDQSTVSRQLAWLFGTEAPELPGFALISEGQIDRIALRFASRFILEAIGIDSWSVEQDAHLENMVERFGAKLPDTRTFSAFARDTVACADIRTDVDEALVAWLEREELLFRAFERHLIEGRLREGFHDVDAFLQFSLSVQNRRKVRAGSALENHLEHIFQCLGIDHSRTPVTEGRSRPDFLFPGASAYHDPFFPVEKLTVLAAKTSCKDRWRQVLAEADRIPEKHLLTLEPAITVSQTAEMQQKNVRLVVPADIQATYTPAQQSWLMNASELMLTLFERQSEASRRLL